VQISGEKMSKSLNNFKTLEDVLKIYRGNVVRYMLLATHYRSPIDFAEDLLEQAKTAVSRIQNFYDRVFGENEGTSSFDTDKNIKKLFLNFEDAMNDDFDTSGALAALFDFIKEVNAHIDKFGINREGKDKVLDALRRIDSVLGLISFEHLDIDEKILKIIEERENARKKKDFKTADKIRERLLKKGIIIIDTDSGTKWKKVI
jgi:cysteinyl-tRNA synthetase